jgi:hypothetical protein
MILVVQPHIEKCEPCLCPDLLIKFLLRPFNWRGLIGRLDGYAKSDFDVNSCESQFAIEVPISRTAPGRERE